MTESAHVLRVPYGRMPRKAWKTIGGLTEGDLEAAEAAMARATELEGISYSSVAEFIRDALRRRVEAINEAWRDAHAARQALGPPSEGPRRKER